MRRARTVVAATAYLLSGAAVAWGLFRCRVTATSRGLHVVNGYRTHRYDWAEVLTWEPPVRLILAWKPNPDRTAPTEVEITFTDVGDGQTRVDVEHRGWERIGEDAAEARESYAGYNAWPGVLELFARYVEG